MRNPINIIVICLVMFITSSGAYAQDTWDGTIATSFESGIGTKTNPYKIKTAEQWAYLCTLADHTGKYYELIGNLYFPREPKEDTPLNHYEIRVGNFNGTLDGNGYQIQNDMSCNLIWKLSGTIKNLSLFKEKLHPGRYDCWHPTAFINEIEANGIVDNCYINFNGGADGGGTVCPFGEMHGTVKDTYITGCAYSEGVSDPTELCFSSSLDSKFQNCHITLKGRNKFVTVPAGCDDALITEFEWRSPLRGTTCHLNFHDEIGYSETASLSVERNSTLTLPTPQSSCTFAGWYHKGYLVKTSSLTIDDDVDLYAYWTRGIISQPTSDAPVFYVEDAEHCTYQWYQLDKQSMLYDNWASTNHSSESSLQKIYTVSGVSGQTIQIEWNVSSESADKFSIAINNKILLNVGGEENGLFTYDIPDDGEYTVVLKYTKDDSVNEGLDKAWITNFIVGNMPLALENETDISLSKQGMQPGYSYFCTATYTNESPYFIESEQSYTSNEFTMPEAPQLYIINVLSSCETMGTVAGAGEYEEGAEVTLTAIPSEGYEFVQWSDGSTENPYVFTAIEDKSLTAIFQKVEEEEPVNPNLSELAHAIYADDTQAFVGTSIVLPLCLKNTAAITSFQFDLRLPEGVTIATDSYGDADIQLATERTTLARHSLSYNEQANGDMRVVCTSLKNAPFSGNDGNVVLVRLNIAEGMEEGDYPIVLSNIEMSEPDMTKHKVPLYTSKLHIDDYLLGDVDGDREVTVTDVTGVVNIILGIPMTGANEKAADVSGDGEVTVTDATGVVNIILGIPNGSSTRRAPRTTNAALDIAPFSVIAGETVEVPIVLQSGADEFTGMQFDLVLPAGLRLIDVAADRRHNADFGTRCEGTERIVSLSLSNATYAGNGTAALTLTLAANSDVEAGNILLSGIELVRPDLSNIRLGALSAPFAVAGTTGVEALNAGTAANTIYDLQGRKTRGTVKGVYMQNGQKVIK